MLAQHIKALLQSWFSFPEKKIFCQVSTINNGSPHIRTMDLYDFTDDGTLIFLTNTNSNKWYHLKQVPNIAVCLLHLECGQIIVEGLASLHTSVNNQPLATRYWNYLDEYWQGFYLSYASGDPSSQKEIPLSFGVIEICPHSWEILEINTEDFLKGSRKKFQLQENTWVVTEIPLE
jgi:general stress protein 26